MGKTELFHLDVGWISHVQASHVPGACDGVGGVPRSMLTVIQSKLNIKIQKFKNSQEL